jgi:hypothetical protein
MERKAEVTAMADGTGLRKNAVLLGVVLMISLLLLGLAYAAWNDELRTDFAVTSAEFDPQIEVYEVSRLWQIDLPLIGTVSYSKDFAVDAPCDDDKILIKVGKKGTNHIRENGVPGDRYTYCFTVTNNSGIPVLYRVVNLLTGSAGEEAVQVQPADWCRLEPGESADGNTAEIYLSHTCFSPSEICLGKSFGSEFALVEVKQYDSGGWTSKVKLGINVREFVAARL